MTESLGQAGGSPNGDSGESNSVNERAAPVGEVYGAAPERTILAWQRTALGVVVSCFLLFHTAFQIGVLPVGVVAAALGLGVAGLAVFSFPEQRHQAGPPADSWRLLSVVTIAVLTLGVLGAITGALTLLT